ncbi:MAG TPA: pantetheine-phosphate adenylyltransferase [Planctomycetaceae bacterium]|jgi:pantetheine-phosphate adenylyltransferase|nr:pantetheine-phosphate adenylyltransferase [Planctomycetaceae bacterium]
MPTQLNPRHAVYTGSFDPVSLGHLDIIARGARVFERLTVGVGINPEKHPLFTPQERLELLQHVTREYANVQIACFEGLAVSFVRRCGAAVMLRGLRTLTDIEAEFSMTLANRALAHDIETVFLMASEKYSHISSSLIKQVALLGTDSANEPLEAFVPHDVIAPLRVKFSKSR